LLQDVIKGSFPFLVTDGMVLVLVLFFPVLALTLPKMLIKSVF
jgi:TRAP-type C4-dicarboxylate transport system permease large subunit